MSEYRNNIQFISLLLYPKIFKLEGIKITFIQYFDLKNKFSYTH